jgi:hypothetical protein
VLVPVFGLPWRASLQAEHGVQYVLMVLGLTPEEAKGQWREALRSRYDTMLRVFAKDVAPRVQPAERRSGGADVVARGGGGEVFEVPQYRRPMLHPTRTGAWASVLKHYLERPQEVRAGAESCMYLPLC